MRWQIIIWNLFRPSQFWKCLRSCAHPVFVFIGLSCFSFFLGTEETELSQSQIAPGVMQFCFNKITRAVAGTISRTFSCQAAALMGHGLVWCSNQLSMHDDSIHLAACWRRPGNMGIVVRRSVGR